ncbi:glucose-dependent insulinotropic receptor-like [Asbolus verrucosus]|uniref:Glucose-dependent insulinotropic receptor-like n=1 Tax=Asbolus verrucosus TaxID=1661398 RepID=A0A482WDM4_ASBVE|nr:glucose-dependent insulinotropic receptor-like [Asbolus verrucosus]
MNDSILPTTMELLRIAVDTTTQMAAFPSNVSLKFNKTLNSTNSSAKTQLALYDVLIPSIGVFIILLNFLVVISSGLILKKGQQPRSTYLFLGNVAMTDLITGAAVVFGQLYPKANRDHYICALQLGMIVSSTLTSVYSVGLIAIDRFLYILHGIQYQRWVYPMRARLLIIGTWVIGCIIGFMPLFGWYGDTDNGRICWFILLAPKGLILLTVLCGIVPLLVVLVLYSIILYHAVRNIVKLQNSNSRNDTADSKNLRMFRGRGYVSDTSDSETADSKTRQKNGIVARIFKKKPSATIKSPSKWRAIKIVLFTTGSFVVTWSPYFIASIIYVYQCDNFESKRCKNLSIIIASPLAILGFTNSLINPIIYAWWHKGFRTFVQKRVSTVIMKTRRRNNTVNNLNSNANKSSTTTSDTNKANANKIQTDREEALTDPS